MTTISGHRVRIPGLGTVVFPSSTNIDEMREASENLYQRAAAIRLGLALDNVDPSSASDATKASLYQAIIAYRKSAKHLPAEERQSLERRISAYSNSQVKKVVKR